MSTIAVLAIIAAALAATWLLYGFLLWVADCGEAERGGQL